MQRAPDVLVIGGGVIGCAIARDMARAGRSVVLVERGALGCEASTAAAGVLAVASSDEPPGPWLAFRRASLALFPALAAALAEETGIDVELDRNGVLELLVDGDDPAGFAARARAREAEGFAVDALDARGARAAEPAVAPGCRGALFFRDDAQVRPDRLVAALAASAEQAGADLRRGTAALGAARTGERVTRVTLGTDTVAPGEVVLAAGAWSNLVPGLDPGVAVEPARGQMLALRPLRPLCRTVLSYADGYLVPRRDGEVLVGATVERAGFVKGVTPAGLQALVEKIGRLAPAGIDAPVVRTWSGLRPFAADGPRIGRVAENVSVAVGHYRNGILLAPITAATILATLDGAPPPAEAVPFLPGAARRA